MFLEYNIHTGGNVHLSSSRHGTKNKVGFLVVTEEGCVKQALIHNK